MVCVCRIEWLFVTVTEGLIDILPEVLSELAAELLTDTVSDIVLVTETT